MDPNKLTIKSQEALTGAQDRARRLGHQQVGSEHLLLALLDQHDGLAPRLLQRLDIDPTALSAGVQADLERKPKVTGGAGELGKIYVTTDLEQLLLRAEDEARSLGDQYVSVEHLLLAAAEGKDGAARALTEAGLSRPQLLEALKALRGAQRVTSNNPETSYEALEKYGVDLVAQARAGKMDPVIGRDSEIRRAIRILSRKTKTTRC